MAKPFRGTENAGVENGGVDRRGGKCRSEKYGSDNVLKAIKTDTRSVLLEQCSLR